jgi:ribonuclease D
MIQLNNGANTFLIDIYQMDQNGDVETFELTKKLLRNVFCNEQIVKIFHDCRHDSLALHEFMHCCVKNVYDTSAAQTYKGQLELYKKMDEIALEKLD